MFRLDNDAEEVSCPNREADLKGQQNRLRRSRHDRPDNGISRQELGRLRYEARRKRSDRSMSTDISRTAGTIYDPRDPKQVKKWRKDPSRADLDGVDTEAQQLFGIKVRAVSEVEKRTEVVEKTVEATRRGLKKARSEARTPRKRHWGGAPGSASKGARGSLHVRIRKIDPTLNRVHYKLWKSILCGEY